MTHLWSPSRTPLSEEELLREFGWMNSIRSISSDSDLLSLSPLLLTPMAQTVQHTAMEVDEGVSAVVERNGNQHQQHQPHYQPQQQQQQDLRPVLLPTTTTTTPTISPFILNYQRGLGLLHSLDVADHSDRPYEPVWLICTSRGCSQQLKTEERLQQHLLRDHHLLPNQCVLRGCAESFAMIRSLHEHVLTAHDGVTEWRCPASERCSALLFEGYAALSKHVHLFHQIGCFACISCPFIGFTRAAMMQHYRAAHSGQGPGAAAETAAVVVAAAEALPMANCCTTSNGFAKRVEK
ncbi:hypothetical protein TYRP_017373 [Tyrophagus putrescentiae]|nr:hypothetical protein TYRP_017373 [Tyrophagus putrescentiae]